MLFLLTAMIAMDKKPPMEPDPAVLREMASTHNYTLGRPFHFRVVPDGSAVLFLRSGAKDPRADLYEYDVASGEERLLLSAEILLGGKKEQLSAAEKAARERQRIKTGGFTSFTPTPDGKKLVVKLSGKTYLYDRTTRKFVELGIPPGDILDPRLSPSGGRIAFVRDHNLYVMELKKTKSGRLEGEVFPITDDGTSLTPHGVAEFVAQEEMHRHYGYWWSPDGEHLLFQSNDYRTLDTFTIADASRPELPPLTFPYPRAGRSNADVKLTIVRADGKNLVRVKWDRERYPYLARAVWPKQSGPTILVQSRDQRSQVYLRIDARSGKTTALIEERDPAWLNLYDTTPRWLDGKGYLWATEEGGDKRLELHTTDKKSVERKTVIGPEAGFDALVHVDPKRELLWFTGGPDPREVHLYRAPLYGGAPERISPEGGEHSATFSADGSTFVLTRSTIDALPRTTVHRTDELDGPVARVEVDHKKQQNEIGARAKEPEKKPNVELVATDDAGGFYAAIVRPHQLDPKKKYPVVLYVYGGPLHLTVKSTLTSYLMHQWIADHGFIVVSIDGRGTPRRGREFERALRQRFGDLPLADQVSGLQALARQRPELDLERVGVYGWSFGGYLAALSVLRRPDFFKVAVAGAPVTDWTYYDTHYTERYLGLVDDSRDAYDSANLINYARKLERPLMLIHGIADDNVYFAHTLQLADALFKASRPFELVPLVGLTHQVADPQVREALYRRIVYFLGRVLWS